VKIVVTTCRRPTPRTRSLVKDLVAVLPNAVRIVRGHLTLSMLALQAFDIGASRIVVVRNWKGNPRFLDLYRVVGPGKALPICTLVLKGFKLARECGWGLPSYRPRALYMSLDEVVDGGVDESVLECLIRGLCISVSSDSRSIRESLRVVLERRGERGSEYIEMKFVDESGSYRGPVLRIRGVARKCSTELA